MLFPRHNSGVCEPQIELDIFSILWAVFQVSDSRTVSKHDCRLFHNRGVASTSYVYGLRLRSILLKLSTGVLFVWSSNQTDRIGREMIVIWRNTEQPPDVSTIEIGWAFSYRQQSTWREGRHCQQQSELKLELSQCFVDKKFERKKQQQQQQNTFPQSHWVPGDREGKAFSATFPPRWQTILPGQNSSSAEQLTLIELEACCRLKENLFHKALLEIRTGAAEKRVAFGPNTLSAVLLQMAWLRLLHVECLCTFLIALRMFSGRLKAFFWWEHL